MLPYNSWVSRVAFGVFFLILIGYGYFEARGILYGPQIMVPDSVTTVSEQLIHIQGTALHIASLSLNGKQVAVTETGDFDEPYLLAPGTNRVVLDARDKYGNSTQRVVQIVYVPAENSRPATLAPSATSSDDGSSPTSDTASTTTATTSDPVTP